jgi:hypothetical protein
LQVARLLSAGTSLAALVWLFRGPRIKTVEKEEWEPEELEVIEEARAARGALLPPEDERAA